ncbi:MAG: ABC transporter permease subunit [Firmicutes bacterium]|nr:ABC transporter permease subunit [Bacillota bacterium]
MQIRPIAERTSPLTAKKVAQASVPPKRRTRIQWSYHLMLFPGLLFLIAFSYLPMAGITIAFKEYIPALGFFKSPWVGLANFKVMLVLPEIAQVFINTVSISSSEIVLLILLPVIIALMLNEVRKQWYKRTVQTIIYMPHFISWVILAGMILNLFALHGMVNNFLAAFGVKPINFMASNVWFRPIVVSSFVWTQMGFDTIVYLAALTAINPSLYEAAALDGANRWKQMIHVTIPGIMPTVVLLSALSLGNLLNANFEQVFLMYNPLVYPTGDIIQTWVYRTGLVNANFSLATAVGLLQSVIGFILIVISYRLAYKFANYRIF